jgi:hypothetical protein
MRAGAKATAFFAVRPACVVLLTLLLTLQASAETIFKCSGDNGTDVYSNFPCQSQSGSVVLDGNAQSAQPTASSPTSGNDAGPQGAPSIGMTGADVRAVWGSPADVSREEVVDGLIETWSYSASRSVQFDATGRVSAVQP